MSKNVKQKGKVSIRNYLQKLELGDKVVFKAEPAVQKGVYFRRYHGKSGAVSGKQGFCYKVDIKDGSKTKTIIVHPVHLKRVK